MRLRRTQYQRASARHFLPLGTGVLAVCWFGGMANLVLDLFPPRKFDPKMSSMDVARGLTLIAEDAPELWPDDQTRLLLQVAFRTSRTLGTKEIEACRSTIWDALASEQRAAMPSLAAVAGDLPGGSNLYADPIFHAALKQLSQIAGTPALGLVSDTSDVVPQEDLSTLTRGLYVLAKEGQVSKVQASSILEPCLHAEFALRQRRDAERQISDILPLETRQWIETAKSNGDIQPGYNASEIKEVVEMLGT